MIISSIVFYCEVAILLRKANLFIFYEYVLMFCENCSYKLIQLGRRRQVEERNKSGGKMFPSYVVYLLPSTGKRCALYRGEIFSKE